MTSRQLHQSDNPWRINKIDANYTREEVENNNLLKNVRSIFNKVTPTTKEYMIHRFQELYIYESPVLDKILSLIFKKAVQEPLFCPLYVDMCNQVVRNELIATRSTKVRNALLILAQEHFVSKSSDEFVIKMRADIDAELYPRIKREKQIEMQESQSNYKRRRLGHIRWLGHLYLQNLISVRIITFCVVDLLKTVTTRSLLDGFHPDNEAIECAVKLLEVIGKRLDEEANAAAAAETKPSRLSPPPFPLELTFATLNGAMPLVSCRIRFLIMDLFELRAREWVHRRAEELPRTLDEIKEEIKKEKNADATKSSLFGCFGANTKKVSISSDAVAVGGEARKSSIEVARENSEKEGRAVFQMNSRFMADKQSSSSATSMKEETPKQKRGAESSLPTKKSEVLSEKSTRQEYTSTKSKTRIDIPTANESFDELTDECCCAICSEIFDSAKFIPRSLDCGHAYCEVCIYNGNVRIGKVVKCPTCQSETDLPDWRVLPINYPLIGIAEKLIKSKVDPKITCKACEVKHSPSSVRMCNMSDCEMFNQLLCLSCALDGGHGGHVVKYDIKLETIRNDLRAEMDSLHSQVESKKQSVLVKAKELARITVALESSLSEVNIPAQISDQVDTIASEQDAKDLREISNDLATTLMSGCEAVEDAFDRAIKTASEQFLDYKEAAERRREGGAE